MGLRQASKENVNKVVLLVWSTLKRLGLEALNG